MKVFEGKFVSSKMNNTAIVEVFRMRPHPLYKKPVRLSKKYKVDNSGFENIEPGTKVRIQEIKPISKMKYFKIIEVINKNQTKKVVKESIKKEDKPKKVSGKK
jgi:small subunit ribosomal protein S17